MTMPITSVVPLEPLGAIAPEEKLKAVRVRRLEGKQPIVLESVIEQAQALMNAVGFPKEALPSIVCSVNAHYGMLKMIDAQARLPINQRRNLVTSKQPVTEAMMPRIDKFVQDNLFPYSVLYIAQDGNIAVKAAGWRMKMQADPRIFKKWIEDSLEIIPMGANSLFKKHVVAVFWNGSEFPADGLCDIAELQSRRAKSEAPPSFAGMIAETRAKTRAGRDAIGLPFDTAEDLVDGEEQRQATSVTTRTVVKREVQDAPKPATKAPDKATEKVEEQLDPMGVAEFLSRAWKEKGLRTPQVLADLGVKAVSDIKDFRKAFASLKEGTTS